MCFVLAVLICEDLPVSRAQPHPVPLSQGRLAAPIHQPWPLDAMCFSGFRLAVAATGPSCTFISVIDVPGFELLERGIFGEFCSPNCPEFFLCDER